MGTRKAIGDLVVISEKSGCELILASAIDITSSLLDRNGMARAEKVVCYA